jgi:hypothetical protein
MDSTPHTVHLTSYDRYEDILEYTVPSGTYQILKRDEWERQGIKATFGGFCREITELAVMPTPERPRVFEEYVAGVFASPEGPVFFKDERHVVGRFGQTTASVEDIVAMTNKRMKLYTLNHVEADGRKVMFSLLYEPRIGIGANPYDNEEEDIDILAMIATNIKHEAFFKAYKKDWIAG